MSMMREAKVPNAIGRPAVSVPWKLIHINEIGQHFDPSGLMMVPLPFVLPLEPHEVSEFINGGIPLRLQSRNAGLQAATQPSQVTTAALEVRPEGTQAPRPTSISTRKDIWDYARSIHAAEPDFAKDLRVALLNAGYQPEE